MVVVLPSNRKYDQLKKYLCVEFPIPSQCALARTLRPHRLEVLASVATKIALRMTCKMGGELWSVEIPVSHARALHKRLELLLPHNSQNA